MTHSSNLDILCFPQTTPLIKNALYFCRSIGNGSGSVLFYFPIRINHACGHVFFASTSDRDWRVILELVARTGYWVWSGLNPPARAAVTVNPYKFGARTQDDNNNNILLLLRWMVCTNASLSQFFLASSKGELYYYYYYCYLYFVSVVVVVGDNVER